MSEKEQILALEALRCEAMTTANVVALSGIFADDLLWIHGTGRGDTKAGMLESIGSGSTKYRSIDCSDVSVRIYGGTAFVSGIADIRAEIHGEDRVLQNRFTIAWSRLDDDWKVVNWQSTTVRKPA
ncbi:nuclear transport factor 2 family protein [Paraburkholderia mimosarum]|uniref:nuclear transport factor 2 family protein n=1 Tax=Paraburkholderia mimosarum TaxID=312026 RepID=UPI0039C36E5D